MATPILVSGMGARQSIYEASSTKHHMLGTRGQLTDGRVFYYASSVAAAAVTPGTLMMRAAEVANHDSNTWASGGAAGQKTVTMTLGATLASKNQYQDGHLIGIDGTGSGQYRRIREHPSAASGATLAVTVYDAFETAFAAAAEIALISNDFASVLETPGDVANPILAGVPQYTVPAGDTNEQYFWLQTWGPAAVFGDNSTWVDGDAVVPASAGTGDAGQVTQGAEATATVASDLFPLVGQLIDACDESSDDDYRLVDLRIRP